MSKNNYGFLFSYDGIGKKRTRTSPSRGANLYRTKKEADSMLKKLKESGVMKGKNLRVVKATKREYQEFVKNNG